MFLNPKHWLAGDVRKSFLKVRQTWKQASLLRFPDFWQWCSQVSLAKKQKSSNFIQMLTEALYVIRVELDGMRAVVLHFQESVPRRWIILTCGCWAERHACHMLRVLVDLGEESHFHRQDLANYELFNIGPFPVSWIPSELRLGIYSTVSNELFRVFWFPKSSSASCEQWERFNQTSTKKKQNYFFSPSFSNEIRFRKCLNKRCYQV